MPGIAGIVSRRPAAECQRLVTAMVGSMAYERFYETGTYFASDMGVYAGWTAHEGSFAALESAYSRRDGVRLLWSGECVSGAPAGPAALYSEIGDRFIDQLNGLFSGLLIDRRQNRILLFNDRYGIERLYVHETEDAVYFASEAKALLEVVPELRAFDDEAVAQFLAFGCTLDNRTLFRGVRLLEGGSRWLFVNGARRKERYFAPAKWESQSTLTEAEFESRFRDTFKSILPRYAGNGSSLGISLTGGLDTRMIMASLPERDQKPVCYTFSGVSDETLDERLAARVAADRGLKHHVLRIDQQFLSNYGSYVDRTVHATDGCCGATGAHEIYLNGKARQLSPVRLTGNFGSEVLRSMSTFKPIGLSSELFQGDVARLVASAAAKAPGAGDHPVTFSAFREIPRGLFGSLAAGRSQVTFRTPYLDNDLVELAFRAPTPSRRSPDAALKLIIDHRHALSRIPTDRGIVAMDRGLGHLMRRIYAEVTFKLDYLHKEGLPTRLARFDPLLGHLSKTGVLGLHKYLPFRLWYRRELATYVSDVLTDERTSRLPYFSRAFIDSMLRDHIGGTRNYVREINAVLTLEAADRLIVRATPARVPDRVAYARFAAPVKVRTAR